MISFPLAGFVSGSLGTLMALLSLFLIMIILLQRGKGGGLAGALGGPGGQSAFGSKAGDTFTLITTVLALIWGFVCALTMYLLGTHAPSVADEAAFSQGPAGVQDSDPVPPLGGSMEGTSSSGGLSSELPSLPDLDLDTIGGDSSGADAPESGSSESGSSESDPSGTSGTDDSDETSGE